MEAVVIITTQHLGHMDINNTGKYVSNEQLKKTKWQPKVVQFSTEVRIWNPAMKNPALENFWLLTPYWNKGIEFLILDMQLENTGSNLK